MIEELETLKNFVDLGGVFILAIFLCYQQFKFFSSIDDKLIKILTLLTILTKSVSNFNGVEKVLNKDGEKVAETILKAEAA